RLSDAHVDGCESTEGDRQRNGTAARDRRVAGAAVSRNFDCKAGRYCRRVDCKRIAGVAGVLNRVDVNELARRGGNSTGSDAGDTGVHALVRMVVVIVSWANSRRSAG